MRLVILAALATGCGTLNTARPLAPGEHQVGLTFGGPIVDLGAPIPIPSAVVEGRSGVAVLAERNLDVNYGLNLTALPFGMIGAHAGVAWLVAKDKGAIPAVSIATRLYLYDNHLDARVDPSLRATWALDQVDLTVSWKPHGQLLYVGVSEYIDFLNPALTLTPFLGAELDPGKPGGVGFTVEARYYLLTNEQTVDSVPWVSFGYGSLGFTLGLRYAFPRSTP